MPKEKSSASVQTETSALIKEINGEGKNIILAMTGTSGAIYGLRMLRALLMNDFNVDLILSEYAIYTLYKECGVDLKQSNITSLFPEIMLLKSTVTFHNNLDLKSEIFTNKYVSSGMVISPCSMGFLAGIANGESKNLIEKCADFAFSYSKPLIVVPRETPVNKIHLANMMKILDAGGKIVPAMPSFEYNPKDFNDLADFIAGKVMDLLFIDNNSFA
ncbi:MAG TPA: UbiX family flavin prenyltransferase [Ignavibacteria bacterium]|nr:UbiX family flavin prenyltransferase [Ignavibacteria bacterium]